MLGYCIIILLYYYIIILILYIMMYLSLTKIPNFDEKKKKNLIFLQVFNNI